MKQQPKSSDRRKQLKTGGAAGIVQVAVAIIHQKKEEFLLHYSSGWGEYTFPMVEIGMAERGVKHFGVGRENIDDAVCRAALKALPEQLYGNGEFKFLCEHNEEQFSKREGLWKDY